MNLMKGCFFGAVIAMLVMTLFATPVTRAGPLRHDSMALLAPGTGLAIVLDGQLSTVQTKRDYGPSYSSQSLNNTLSVPIVSSVQSYPLSAIDLRATDLGAWRSYERKI